MKIGIVGGGISSLYISKLLKNNHDVTIFESSNWGGDIQHDYIDGKCYPISTLFAMPGNKLLKNELKNLNIKTRPVSLPLIYVLISVLILLLIGIIGIIKSKKNIFKLSFSIYITLILVITFMVARVYFCNIILSFGADKNCNSMGKFYSYDENILDNLLSPILYATNCGMSKIVESFLNDENITYLNNKVINISRNTNNCTFTLDNGQNMTFDKCIISCKYDDYKSIIQLSEKEENTLSGIKYFDFYSTLIKIPDNLKQLNIKNSIDRFQLEDKIYLVASHTPLDINPDTYIFKKSYKWRMPIVYRRMVYNKHKINNSDKNVFFIGKEIAGNGVNSCMKYAKKISKYF